MAGKERKTGKQTQINQCQIKCATCRIITLINEIKEEMTDDLSHTRANVSVSEH